MKKMIMKLFRIFLTAVVASVAVSCYNDFDMPKPAVTYNDDFMQAMGMTHISIADLKAQFGEISGTGSTNVSDGLDKTMYKRFVQDKSLATEWEQKTNRYIVGNYYIKGKVISNDEQGNIYKSLYIYDGTAAIELKLTNGLFLDYPCDLDNGKTVEVFVRLDGLYMGNFRMMLSIGDIPTEGMNSYGREKFYPNSNIVSPIKVRQHVFKGEVVTLTKGRLSNDGNNYNQYDILEIDKDNCSVLRAPKFFGRLMLFKDVKVMYKGVPNQEGTTPEKLDDGFYPSWICTSGTLKTPVKDEAGNIIGWTPLVTEFKDMPWGKLAYSQNNVALYGQMCVGYNETANYKSEAGIYIVRTSGYSRYAGKYVPRDGATGSILAIYSIYSKQSTYQGGDRDYAAYQLTPCRFGDILPEYYSKMTEEDEKEMAQWALPVSQGGAIDDLSFELPQSITEDDAEE